MDDLLKVLVYIIAVVIYALAKMRKKPKPREKSVIPQAPKQPLPHTTPSGSFADHPPKKPAPSLDKAIKKLEKDIRHTKQKVETRKQAKPGKVYESKNQYETTVDKLERTDYELNIQNHFDKIQHYDETKNYHQEIANKDESLFQYSEAEEKFSNPYAEFLKDPENIKTAFVAKEIFDRKQY